MAYIPDSITYETVNNIEVAYEGGKTLVTGTMTIKGISKEITFEAGPHMGYHFEASHVMECLDKNLKESPILPHSLSLDLINILDRVR